MRICPDGEKSFTQAILITSLSSKYSRVFALKIIDSGGICQIIREFFTKPKRRNITHADRFSRKMNQFQSGRDGFLNVSPKINHWVKLEHTTTVNCIEIIMIQQIINNIFAQTRAY